MEEKKIIKEQLDNSLPEVRAILNSRSWTKVSEEVVQKNNLLPEQIVSFENEILFVLLGMELIKNFSDNLRINVGLTENRADEIDKEIYERVFKNLEQFLPIEVESEGFVKETKKEIVERLSQRVEVAKQNGAPSLPEIVSKKLPMIEKGEVVHDVPPMSEVERSKIPVPTVTTPPTSAKPTPAPHYQGGSDPYREPIE